LRIINVYILISIVFNAVQARTLWLTRPSTAIATVFTLSLGLKCCILFLDAKEKGAYLQQDEEKHSPEETSGVYNESVFFWLRSLLIQGTKKILEINDLYTLNEDLATENISPNFRKYGVVVHQSWPQINPKI
jgi:hypothetical protein